jgi:hypothetical protein
LKLKTEVRQPSRMRGEVLTSPQALIEKEGSHIHVELNVVGGKGEYRKVGEEEEEEEEEELWEDAMEGGEFEGDFDDDEERRRRG